MVAICLHSKILFIITQIEKILYISKYNNNHEIITDKIFKFIFLNILIKLDKKSALNIYIWLYIFKSDNITYIYNYPNSFASNISAFTIHLFFAVQIGTQV